MKSEGVWHNVRNLGADVYGDLIWLWLYTLAGGLAPLLFAWSYKAIRTASLPSVGEFALAGEFSLYAAGMIAPAAYLLAHDRKKRAFPGRVGLMLVCGFLIVGAVFCYMLVAPQVFSGGSSELTDERLYSNVTISLFVVSVAFYCVVSILDSTRTMPDVRNMDNQQVNDLRGRVSDLPE